MQLTPSNQSRIQLAQALQSNALSNQPIGSPIQVLGRLAQAYAGKKIMDRQAQQQQDAQAALSDALSGAMSGQDPRQLAQMLLSNPQTSDVGQQLAMSLMSQKPDRTTLQKNLIDAGLTPGTPEYQQAILNSVNKPLVSMGENILGSDAAKWLNDKGEPANPTLTVQQATQQGYRPRTTDDLKKAQSGLEAAPLVGNLAKYAFDPQKGSLFPAEGTNVISRGIQGVQSYLNGVTDSDTRIKLYNSTKQAFLSNMARLSGQVGTLTDRDVGLVAGLFPTPGFTPENVAKDQFRQVANFLLSKGVPKDKLIDSGLPEWAFNGDSKYPTPQTQEEYNNLPSGSVYIDPEDGKQYRKP